MATASYTNRLPHLGAQPRDEETLRSAYRQASQALSPIMAVSSPETEEYSVPQTPADDEEDEIITAVHAGLYQQPAINSWVYPSHNTSRSASSTGSDSRPLARQLSSQGGMQSQQSNPVPMSRTLSARRRGSCGRAPSLSTILQSPQLDSDRHNNSNDVDEDNISPRSSFSFGRQMGSRNHVRGGSIGASIGQTLAQTPAAAAAAAAAPAYKMSYEQALERQMSARKLSATSRQQRRSFSTVKTAAAAVFDAPGSTFDNGLTKYKLVQAARSIRLDPSQIDPLAKDSQLSTPTSGSFNSRRTSMSPTDVSGSRMSMSRRPSALGSPYGLQCGDVPIRRISCTSPRSTSFAAAASMGNDLDGELMAMSGSPAAIAHASQGLALTTQSLNDASFYAKEQRVRQVSTSSILSASFMSMKLPASSSTFAGRGRRPSELSVDMRRESLAEKFAAQDGLLITSVATVSTQADGTGMAPRVVDALTAAAKSVAGQHAHGQGQGHRHTHSWAPLSRKKSVATTYLTVPSLSMQGHGHGPMPVKSKPRRGSRQLSFNTVRSISPGRRCSSDLSVGGDSRRPSATGNGNGSGSGNPYSNEHRRRRSSSIYAPPVHEIHLDGPSPTSTTTPIAKRRRSSVRKPVKQVSPAGSHWSPDNSDEDAAACAAEGDDEDEDDELTPTTSSIGHAGAAHNVTNAAAAGAGAGAAASAGRKAERRSSYIPMFLSPELTATSSPPQAENDDDATDDERAPRLSLKPTSPLLGQLQEGDVYSAAGLFDDRHAHAPATATAASAATTAPSSGHRSRGTSETSVFSMIVREGRKMSVCVVESLPDAALAALAGGRRKSSVDEAAIAQAAAYATAVAGDAVDQARAFVRAVSAVEVGDDRDVHAAIRRASRAERRASRATVEQLPDDDVQLDDNDDDYEDCTTTDEDDELDVGLDRRDTLSEASDADQAHLDEAPCSDSDDEGSVVSVATRAVRMRPALMPSALGGGSPIGGVIRDRTSPAAVRPLLSRNATYSPPSPSRLASASASASALSPRPVALRANSDKLFATLRLQDELAAAAAAGGEVETPAGPRSPDLYNGAPRSPRLNAPRSPAIGASSGNNGWQSPRFPGAQWSSEPNTPTFAAPRLSSPRIGAALAGGGGGGWSSSPSSPRQAQLSQRQPLILSTSPGSPGRYMPSSPLATPTGGRRRFLSTSTTASDDDDDAADADADADADAEADAVVEAGGKGKSAVASVAEMAQQAELERRRRSMARDLELSQLRALVTRLTDRIDKLEATATASAAGSAAGSTAGSSASSSPVASSPASA